MHAISNIIPHTEIPACDSAQQAAAGQARLHAGGASAISAVCTLQKSIVQKEGVGALFKGGLVRAVWTAPQGAMNFAGKPSFMLCIQIIADIF